MSKSFDVSDYRVYAVLQAEAHAIRLLQSVLGHPKRHKNTWRWVKCFTTSSNIQAVVVAFTLCVPELTNERARLYNERTAHPAEHRRPGCVARRVVGRLFCRRYELLVKGAEAASTGVVLMIILHGSRVLNHAIKWVWQVRERSSRVPSGVPWTVARNAVIGLGHQQIAQKAMAALHRRSRKKKTLWSATFSEMPCGR